MFNFLVRCFEMGGFGKKLGVPCYRILVESWLCGHKEDLTTTDKILPLLSIFQYCHGIAISKFPHKKI